MGSKEYLFHCLEEEAYKDEGPFFTFFVREESIGDFPIFIRNPSEGALWSKDTSYGTKETHPEKGGVTVEPSKRFETLLKSQVLDPEWRAILNDDEDGDSQPTFDIDEQRLRELPVHEHYMLKLIGKMGEQGYPLSSELKEYLIQL